MVGVWDFLPTTYPCLSPNPLLDHVTRLAFSAWNLVLLTAVAILEGAGHRPRHWRLPPLPLSVLLLTSRQSRSGSLETWTRVLEVIRRPQVCRRWTEEGKPRTSRELRSCHHCPCSASF